MSYISEINKVYLKIYTFLSTAGIKNLRNFGIKFYKKAIPAPIETTQCPIISIFKTEISGSEIVKDQFELQLPKNLKVIIGFADFSQVDLDDAEKYTDDLIDKVIEKLRENPTLDDLVKGITVSRFLFDWDAKDNAWFSLPSMELELVTIEPD